MDTEIIILDPGSPDLNMIRKAARGIANGGLVIFPTETVYGIGANALSKDACKKIYAVKKRPADNPLIVHISDIDQLDYVARDVSGQLREILAKIWPGPVTFLLKKSSNIDDVVTAGHETVAVRMPSNMIARMLIREAGVPVAAPSANIATRPSIVDPIDAISEFYGAVDFIIDGGESQYGIESTIVDPFKTPPLLLRPGAYTVDSLEKYFGKIALSPYARGVIESRTAVTPGMKYRHYAPQKRLVMVSSSDLFLDIVNNFRGRIFPICSRDLADRIDGEKYVLGERKDLLQIAKNLFRSFRVLDRSSSEAGIIEVYEETGIGLAIMNRIRKATENREVSSIGDMDIFMKEKH